MVIIDLIGDTDNCKPDCQHLITLWGGWVNSDRPFGKVSYSVIYSPTQDEQTKVISHLMKPAMITIPSTHAEYLKDIGCKSRNMIHKAQRNGYFTQAINYNDYIEDIYQVNISKPVRQGYAMTKNYCVKPEPLTRQYVYCKKHFAVYFGAIREQKLFAWANISFMNDLAIVNQILGHGEHLKHGIMNELVSGIVKYCIENTKAKFINYLSISNCLAGLRLFKQSVGFKELDCRFVKNL